MEQPQLLIYLAMVINGSCTRLFASGGLTVLAAPRLGNVRLRFHFLRRGTRGVGAGYGTPAIPLVTF